MLEVRTQPLRIIPMIPAGEGIGHAGSILLLGDLTSAFRVVIVNPPH
jgi:hypothetical protein